MAIEIVSFPMKNGGSFHSFLYVYQIVTNLYFQNTNLYGTYIYIYTVYPYGSKHCLRRYLTLQIIVNYTPNTS